MRIRVYYYNMVKDGKVLGSVKCETATRAKAITASILGVDPESLSTRRVSAVVAAPPVELYKKPEEKNYSRGGKVLHRRHQPKETGDCGLLQVF